MKKIEIMGCGYIGLPTAITFTLAGYEVCGFDVKDTVVDTLNAGHIHIVEPGLQDAMTKAMATGRLHFTTKPEPADVFIICVQTPYRETEEHKRVSDMRFVESAAKEVGSVLRAGNLCVLESTSPPYSTRMVEKIVSETSGLAPEQFMTAHCPERIIPGNMVYELLHNNRTIGADDPEVGEEVANIYATFCQGEISVTDIRTAEMTKVVENTFRAINIAFSNELAKICRIGGMDVAEVIRISNKHPRVNILQPGPGVGGHCIPVDPWFLVGDYPETANFIRLALQTNAGMPEYVLHRAHEVMAERGIKDASKVGIYGLTYKEDVYDVRESPTLQMLESMEDHLCGGAVKVYDPWVERDEVPGQVHSMEEFLDGLEMVIVMVGHSQIKGKPEAFGGRILIDPRNVCGDGENVYKL